MTNDHGFDLDILSYELIIFHERKSSFLKEILEDRSHHELKTQSKSLEEWERYLEFRIQSRVLFKLFEELLYVAAQVDPLGLLKPISESGAGDFFQLAAGGVNSASIKGGD